MNLKILTRLRRVHVRLDHDVRAEAARRAPDVTRLSRLKKLRLMVKDQLTAAGQSTASA